MDFKHYLDAFQQAANRLDKKAFSKKGIEIAVGVVLDSVFLKLYKKEWTSDPANPLTAESRIFFSVWTNDPALAQEKLFYNIHALKLRQLKGYSIQSRQFAGSFREQFKRFEPGWPNVSVQFGPLTLMEGWVRAGDVSLQDELTALANKFLAIGQLIDDALAGFKKE